MKKTLLMLLLVLLTTATSFGQVGCRIGNYILIMDTGGYTADNPGDRFPLYSTAGQITKRDWADDPRCGILRSTADGYPTAPGGQGNPRSKCSPDNNKPDYGVLVYYKNSDNTCKTVNAPLDNYTPVFAILIGVIAVYFIRKRNLLNLM